MALIIEDAVKQQEKVRMAIIGPSGSGKTWTALLFAGVLAEGGTISVLDTEKRAARKYAQDFPFKFRVIDKLPNYSPEIYIEALDLLEKEDPAVLIVDGISQAWAGKEGILETVDRISAAGKSAFYDKAGWRTATPAHNRLVDRLIDISTRRHLIVTMRVKMAYVEDTDERGKKKPVKIGLQPIQRSELEYEFDIVADMNTENTMVISKTRCAALNKGVFPMPGCDVAQRILDWCNDGAIRDLEDEDDGTPRVEAPYVPKSIVEPPTNGSIPLGKPTREEVAARLVRMRDVYPSEAAVQAKVREVLKLPAAVAWKETLLHSMMTRAQFNALSTDAPATASAIDQSRGATDENPGPVDADTDQSGMLPTETSGTHESTDSHTAHASNLEAARPVVEDTGPAAGSEARLPKASRLHPPTSEQRDTLATRAEAVGLSERTLGARRLWDYDAVLTRVEALEREKPTATT